MNRSFSLLLVLAAAGVAGAQSGPAPKPPPIELGSIAWIRDFDAAKAESRRSGRPMLVLFQEVPG